jgi:signal transduction histidine kinase
VSTTTTPLKMKKVSFTVFILIAALIVDAIFSNLSDVMNKQLASGWGIALFISITITIFAAGQYLLLGFVNQVTKDLRIKKLYFNLIYNVVAYIQYALMAILLFTITQIVFTSQYYVVLIVAVIAISYTPSTVIMVLLSYRFFSWYRSNRKNIVVLLYGLATAMTASGMIAGNISQNGLLLLEKQSKVSIQSNVLFPSMTTSDSTMTMLFSAMFIQLILAYLFAWGASALLLRDHFQRLRRVSYWTLISIPLISFLFGALPVLIGAPTNNEFAYFNQNLLSFRILSTIATIAGGILFGLAFSTTSKTLRKIYHHHPNHNVLADFMTMSSYGVVLLTISFAANIIQAPYPPFGVPAISFISLGSYLFSFGLYSASISISEDANLRLSIKKSAIEESKLLSSMDSTQEMDQKIQTKVIGVAKQQAYNMMQKTGIPSSLTEHDMKQYLSTVLKEIRVLQNVNEIVDIEKEILGTSHEFNACLKFNAMRLIYNNYFDLYKQVIVRYRNKDHKGIRWITSITDKKDLDLVKKFLDIGVQIRHVKNMPPIDFVVSDKDMLATIEKVDREGRGGVIQNLLVSKESPYIQHFTSIFAGLWNQGVDVIERIKDMEAGVDFDIEVIQSSLRVQKIYLNTIKSAANEILLILPTANAVTRQEKLGVIRLTINAVKERNVKVRILMPAHESIQHVSQKLTAAVEENNTNNISFRFIEQMLGTKATILVVDRKSSLVMELKDDSKLIFTEAIGLSTFSNSKPGVLSYVAIFENLWRQTELYQKLSELYEQLKLHDKMQKEFINIAAHELRTPTQVILGYVNLIARHPERRDEMLQALSRNATRLQKLTTDILDVSRIESQTLKINKERFNINEKIRNVVNDMQSNEDATIEIIFAEPADDPIVVEADTIRIYEVISNLLTNAIKFTKKGRSSSSDRNVSSIGPITIFAALKTSQDDKKGRSSSSDSGSDEVIVSIKDRGTGIDPDLQDRLFTKFATNSDTGSGLGLFISKGIIEAHGGTIWAQNNTDGKGATFAFSLPLSEQQ